MVSERGASLAYLRKKEWVTNRERRNRKMEVRRMREEKKVRKKKEESNVKMHSKGKINQITELVSSRDP